VSEFENQDDGGRGGVLRAVLGETVTALVAGDALDPERIITVGRGLRRRRRVAGSAGVFALAAVAIGVYATVGSFGTATSVTPAGSPTTAAVVTPSFPPAGELPGKVLASGVTHGVRWQTSAVLEDYLTEGNSLPSFCVYVWTSTGVTNPRACAVQAQPDPPDTVNPGLPQAGTQGTGIRDTDLQVEAIYTSHVTTLKIGDGSGGTVSVAPVELSPQVYVSAAVFPSSGGTIQPIGPQGTGAVITLEPMTP
jgi:hypothetical protein